MLQRALLWLLLSGTLLLPCGCGSEKSGGPSLEDMAGQLILCGFRGTGEEPLSEDLRLLLEDIRAGRVGGVIFFDRDALLKQPGRNVLSLEQLGRLTRLLQKDAPVPLFIGIDQEGGRVRRLREEHGAPPMPSAREMGLGDEGDTFAVAELAGVMLADIGVNLDFAPSLDLDVAPDSPAIGALGRSFSADAQSVAAHGAAFAKGLASAGVIACYKHFPGHGSARDDTHLGLADITATWREAELEPYRRVLPESPPAMVMPGHIVHRKLGGDLPASLSPAVITGLLRGRLGWQGVVVTDDLQMEAVAGHYSEKETIRLALKAGADVLLFGNNLRHDPGQGRKVHALLMELVREGALSPERIRESYRRVMELKRQAGLL